jgi:hypothetical protein
MKNSVKRMVQIELAVESRKSIDVIHSSEVNAKPWRASVLHSDGKIKSQWFDSETEAATWCNQFGGVNVLVMIFNLYSDLTSNENFDPFWKFRSYGGLELALRIVGKIGGKLDFKTKKVKRWRLFRMVEVNEVEGYREMLLREAKEYLKMEGLVKC